MPNNFPKRSRVPEMSGTAARCAVAIRGASLIFGDDMDFQLEKAIAALQLRVSGRLLGADTLRELDWKSSRRAVAVATFSEHRHQARTTMKGMKKGEMSLYRLSPRSH